MASVTIWKDEYALFKSAKLPFPFTMEQFIDGLDKIGCPRELRAIEKISYDIENVNEYHQAIITSRYSGENNNQPIIYVNILALLSDAIDSYDFDKVMFYVREIGVYNMFEFANVICQIENSNIYSYSYSEPGESADARLGKEITVGMCEEYIADWLIPYINFGDIGYDNSGEYYYDDDFYVDSDDIGIDDQYYDDWDELTDYELDEWNFAEFKELLVEQENTYETSMKFTEDILDFLEKGA